MRRILVLGAVALGCSRSEPAKERAPSPAPSAAAIASAAPPKCRLATEEDCESLSILGADTIARIVMYREQVAALPEKDATQAILSLAGSAETMTHLLESY